MTTPSPTVLAAAEEIESRFIFAYGTRESLCEIIQTAIDVELARVTDVLEFYANKDMYYPDWADGRETILKDRGSEARKALGK